MKRYSRETVTGGRAPWWRNLLRLARDDHGIVAVFTAIWAAVLFGFVGFATDAGSWYTIQMRMQTAADAAALNAAYAILRDGGPDAQTAAEADATRNGFTDGDGGVEVQATVINDGTVCGEAYEGTAVEVVITGPGERTFSRLFLDQDATIAACAAAGLTFEILCLLALDEDADRGLWADSNALLDAEECDIHVNSGEPEGIYTDSNAEIIANSICVQGGWDSNSNSSIDPEPTTGCPPMDDPLVGVPEPDPPACEYTDVEIDSVTVTLDPDCVYSGGLYIKGNAHVTLMPGVYFIQGGVGFDKGLLVDSNSHIQGDGVMFFLTGGAEIQFLSNVTFDLSAPTTGDQAGILFFEDRDDPDQAGLEHFFDSNTTGSLNGTIYLSQSSLRLDSNAVNQAGGTFCTPIIAQTVKIDSNVDLLHDFHQCLNVVPDDLLEEFITLLA